MKAYTASITVGSSPQAQRWLDQFSSWLDVAPHDVTALLSDGEEVASDVVTVHDAIAFIRQRGERTPAYNGRSVFYYLIDNARDQLVVRCTQCNQRYGVCRCPDRGESGLREWQHHTFYYAATNKGQDFWVIERSGLVALDRSKFPPDTSSLRRERVFAFLNYLRKG